MTPLVPIMLIGWVPFTIFLFFTLKPHRAVLISVIGGWLLLPHFTFSWQGIPDFNKYAAISLGLVLGSWLSGQRFKADFRWRLYDMPMVLWCLAPIPSALTNQLGLYDGLSSVYSQLMAWGIPYLAGRIYFKDDEALRDLCWGIFIGGMVYALLCLYEIRMSPRLSINIYGIFPHEWLQHRRYGGWRPIVFMQHGLMVAVWMAAAATTAFWLWRSRLVTAIKGVPMGLIAVILIVTTLLCKAASGWVVLVVGCAGYFAYRRYHGNLPFVLLLLVIPVYMGARILDILPVEQIITLAANLFDADRTGSLAIRLKQEGLFVARAMESPLFGWGGYSRGWPVDPETGRRLIQMVDALWIIVFSQRGFFGLIALVTAMLIGPWLVLRSTAGRVKEDSVMMAVLLSLAVVLFMTDTLFNAMVNPIFIMTSGSLLGWHLAGRQGIGPASSRQGTGGYKRKQGLRSTREGWKRDYAKGAAFRVDKEE